MNDFIIVTDSSSNLTELCGTRFAVAPLKIISNEKEYIDDSTLNVDEMANYFLKYSGKSSTSCPNTQDWLNAFGDAKYIICVTITAALSGCYNAACIAKQIYEEKYPDRKVFVLNSLSTGPEMHLLIDRINELIANKNSFEEICEKIVQYKQSTGLLFMLESMRNLANNGRVSQIVAKAAGLLNIRAVGKASKKGELQLLDKVRGTEKALCAIISRMKEMGWKQGKVYIAHCLNEETAVELKSRLEKECEQAKIEMYACRGLCSYYAEKGGMIIGFEKF